MKDRGPKGEQAGGALELAEAGRTEDSLAAGRRYRYEHLALPLVLRDMYFSKDDPGPGARVPEFDLPTLEGGRFRSIDLGVPHRSLRDQEQSRPRGVSGYPVALFRDGYGVRYVKRCHVRDRGFVRVERFPCRRLDRVVLGPESFQGHAPQPLGALR